LALKVDAYPRESGRGVLQFNLFLVMKPKVIQVVYSTIQNKLGISNFTITSIDFKQWKAGVDIGSQKADWLKDNAKKTWTDTLEAFN
jgi:hypothetical protein